MTSPLTLSLSLCPSPITIFISLTSFSGFFLSFSFFSVNNNIILVHTIEPRTDLIVRERNVKNIKSELFTEMIQCSTRHGVDHFFLALSGWWMRCQRRKQQQRCGENVREEVDREQKKKYKNTLVCATLSTYPKFEKRENISSVCQLSGHVMLASWHVESDRI